MKNSLLHQIGLKHGTDKALIQYKGISYLDIYERYFSSIRDDVKNIVEIGIFNGKSLSMWEEYFPNANIIGVDINPACKAYETDRIKIFIGDQNDDNFLKDLSNQFKDIDILIDDGSHITKHQINTFNHLYPSIKKEGFYVVEDLRNSYEEYLNHHDVRSVWPGMWYNKKDDELKNFREDFNKWVNDMVKKLDFHDESNMLGIYHYPMILIIENK